MRRSANRSFVAFGCFAIAALGCRFVSAQSEERPQRLLQSAADIGALPSSDKSDSVRAGFTPAQSGSASNSGYRGSFYQQQASADVYPYPTSDRPRAGASSRSAYALSGGTGGGRLSNQISIGSNTSTGDLGGNRYASNTGFASNSSYSNGNRASVYNVNSNTRSPVEQQRSSTLNPVAQARINQAAVDRRSQSRSSSNQESRSGDQRPERSASRNNLFNGQARTVFRQSANTPRQAAANNGTSARYAQANCCQPNYNPVSASYQGAAFQAPAINPTVGAGLGLGVPPLNIQNPAGVGGFNQPALPQQCCQPQVGFAGAAGQVGYPQGYQGVGCQGGGYPLGAGVGTPQFGAQGARWWTPFVRGSGVYTPLLDLSPNKAGTYLGQGIIGQPTAYVNGQLLRNLLRYLSP